ncbi:DUF4124 domain-containing protein [Cupriavidus metallidurans]|uniref:DUF4124 domain-containing protein n=1 Tax=Cupriavidus TaxID=106589 RepID=UPI0002A37BC6|nr:MULTISPECIES: DUF4124 domain-containing protein [Cupriavidus]EKZ95549.1 hypothetical protein D769_29809 [Cupriavidus sp. HMR-1]HBO79321.1 DUF4124 domain-containing protein [Cupriavidus sp.]
MNRSSVLYLLIAASLAVPGTAFSQWQWKDTNGRTVYSDTPPPPSVPDRAIIMAPGRAPGMYHAVEADAPPKGDAPAKADAPRMQPTSVKAGGAKPKDADTEFQERRDARLKADLEAATKEREQLARQQNCQELRNYAAGLNQGMRAAKAGPDGVPVRLNDDERAAEIARTNDALQQCNS